MDPEGQKAPPVAYMYLRALELEGMHPDDVGAWTITGARVIFGEGIPDSSHPLYQLPTPDYPVLPSSPNIPKQEKPTGQYGSYHVFHDVASVITHLQNPDTMPLSVSVPLSTEWVAPKNGWIFGNEAKVLYSHTHSLALRKTFQLKNFQQMFAFSNSWGPEWGSEGWGALSTSYFDRYAFEAYALLPSIFNRPTWTREDSLKLPRTRKTVRLKKIMAPIEGGKRHYTFTIGKSDENRFGWSIFREERDCLLIEDIYVRPEFRNSGIGTLLINEVANLGKKKKLPVRCLMTWAESRQHNPKQFETMVRFARSHGFTFLKCPTLLASYFAENTKRGSDEPFEPLISPTRARGPLTELVAMASVILGAATPIPIDNHQINIPQAIQQVFQGETIQDQMQQINCERKTLLKKWLREPLTKEEVVQLDELQQRAFGLVNKISPPDMSKYDFLLNLLNSVEGREKS